MAAKMAAKMDAKWPPNERQNGSQIKYFNKLLYMNFIRHLANKQKTNQNKKISITKANEDIIKEQKK